MPRKLTEDLAIDCIVPPQDVGTADVTGSWIDVSKCGRFVVLAKAGAVTVMICGMNQLVRSKSSVVPA